MSVRNASPGRYDVIVVGSGGAGLSAACTAAALGQRVVVLETTDRVGGTTAISGGMVWIPDNHKMREAGMMDSTQAVHAYLAATVPGFDKDRRMAAFLAHADGALRFLEQHTSLRLRPVPRYPDYYPELPGATAGGRVLEPVPFDAMELGADFAVLRDPLPEFMLFGGMMISREDLPVLRRAGRSPTAAWHTLKLIARYGLQRMRAHRGTTLVLGNALAARLMQSARGLGVEIRLRASVVGLSVNDGRVTGVRADVGDHVVEIEATRGVILATGGISHECSLRRKYVPTAAGAVSATVASGALRAGVRLAMDAGAAVSLPANSVDDALAFWVPASMFRRTNGSVGIFPHTVSDRAKPGLIAVGSDGRRFVNEAVSYHEFVRAQLRAPERAIPAWLICDRRFLWRYGLGRVRPFSLSTQDDITKGYLKRGSTLADLARAINVPLDALSSTVTRYNEHARRGEDIEFGRGANIYQRHLGDADHQPNPCVAPIEHAPFYAVAVQPADLGMAAGALTDENAQVLDNDGEVIAGLYACGNDMHSIMNGAYPGPGITLGPALVFGYMAARHAAGRGNEPQAEATASKDGQAQNVAAGAQA
jgi:succinate dehydrogenase/fumarate reductase flavoprotein subunit